MKLILPSNFMEMYKEFFRQILIFPQESMSMLGRLITHWESNIAGKNSFLLNLNYGGHDLFLSPFCFYLEFLPNP